MIARETLASGEWKASLGRVLKSQGLGESGDVEEHVIEDHGRKVLVQKRSYSTP